MTTTATSTRSRRPATTTAAPWAATAGLVQAALSTHREPDLIAKAHT